MPSCDYESEPNKPVKVHPVIEKLRRGELTDVLVLAGAGISVSAGIPDFRSPGTGLYSNLKKYNIPDPADMFTLDYFRKDPEPFTLLAKELWPMNVQPTLAHRFVRLLELKGLLRRHYTQNIDGLDSTVGISERRLVQAHGSFGEGHCIDCQRAFEAKFLKERIFRGEVVRCQCGGLVKPDIVFFGEQLPEKYLKFSQQDFQQCGLVICMGTSLQVEPFASLINSAPVSVPRVLINREVPASFRERPGDLILTGDCDEQVLRLTEALGWTDELILGKLIDVGVAGPHLPQITGASHWHRGVLAVTVALYLACVFLRPPPREVTGITCFGVGAWCFYVAVIALCMVSVERTHRIL